jgi:hypothetical protein
MEESTKHKNWFQRNWKWALPTGGCLLVIILFVVFAGTMILGLTSMFKDSEPYKFALSNAQSNALVINALGEPIEAKGVTKGTIDYSDNESHTNLEIPIRGPKGKAILRVVAFKYNDEWEYNFMEVIIDETSETIPLLILDESLDD